MGDPIEVSALGQALASQPGSKDIISLGSVKACYGHTEGAAGVTGALLASSELRIQSRPAVMHLRTMNPYVEAALQDWRKSSGAEASIARQTQPSSTSHASGETWPVLSGKGPTEFATSLQIWSQKCHNLAICFGVSATKEQISFMKQLWDSTRLWLAAADLISLSCLIYAHTYIRGMILCFHAYRNKLFWHEWNKCSSHRHCKGQQTV